jgi:hypothetical protein
MKDARLLLHEWSRSVARRPHFLDHCSFGAEWGLAKECPQIVQAPTSAIGMKTSSGFLCAVSNANASTDDQCLPLLLRDEAEPRNKLVRLIGISCLQTAAVVHE